MNTCVGGCNSPMISDLCPLVTHEVLICLASCSKSISFIYIVSNKIIINTCL